MYPEIYDEVYYFFQHNYEPEISTHLAMIGRSSNCYFRDTHRHEYHNFYSRSTWRLAYRQITIYLRPPFAIHNKSHPFEFICTHFNHLPGACHTLSRSTWRLAYRQITIYLRPPFAIHNKSHPLESICTHFNHLPGACHTLSRSTWHLPYPV